MSVNEAITKRILDLCMVHNISINKLATLSVITQSTLNSIVKGESKNPQLQTIVKICYGLDISLSDFFDAHYFDNLDIF